MSDVRLYDRTFSESDVEELYCFLKMKDGGAYDSHQLCDKYKPVEPWILTNSSWLDSEDQKGRISGFIKVQNGTDNNGMVMKGIINELEDQTYNQIYLHSESNTKGANVKRIYNLKSQVNGSNLPAFGSNGNNLLNKNIGENGIKYYPTDDACKANGKELNNNPPNNTNTRLSELRYFCGNVDSNNVRPVSYTHLTLPTILLV